MYCSYCHTNNHSLYQCWYKPYIPKQLPYIHSTNFKVTHTNEGIKIDRKSKQQSTTISHKNFTTTNQPPTPPTHKLTTKDQKIQVNSEIEKSPTCHEQYLHCSIIQFIT